MPLRVNAKNPRNLRVLHTQMGSWPKGHILSENDLPHPSDPRDTNLTQEDRDAEHNANVQRLINVGAVEVVTEQRTGNAPLGADSIHQTKANAANANADGLDDLHVDTLKDQARDLDIKGFSTLNKAELIDAIRDAKSK